MENVPLNSENFKEFRLTVQQIPSHQTRKANFIFSLQKTSIAPQFTHSFIHSYIHLVVCLTTGPCIFLSEFSTECDLVLPISISSVLFSFKSSGMCVRLLPRLPVTYVLPSTFPSILVLEDSSYTRCVQSTSHFFFLLYVGYS
jgi:hypothetical protein